METKTNDNQIKEKSITGALLPSILSIILCVLCLCASSWAWFVDKEESGKTTLKAGSFNVTVEVSTKDDVPVTLTDMCATLVPGEYKVKIVSVSTASGYVVVSDLSTPADDFYTQRLAPGGTPGGMTEFSFKIDEPKTIGFMPMLGFVPEGMHMISTD